MDEYGTMWGFTLDKKRSIAMPLYTTGRDE
jgi:hypothetical protein